MTTNWTPPQAPKPKKSWWKSKTAIGVGSGLVVITAIAGATGGGQTPKAEPKPEATGAVKTVASVTPAAVKAETPAAVTATTPSQTPQGLVARPEAQATSTKVAAVVKTKAATTAKPVTKQSTPAKPAVVAKPTPKPVINKPVVPAKPTPKPVVAKPTPKPVVAKPTPKPVAPKPTPKPVAPKPTPKKTTTKPSTGVYYANCDAVRAAGVAPIKRGQPGYRAKLDGDSDGLACE